MQTRRFLSGRARVAAVLCAAAAAALALAFLSAPARLEAAATVGLAAPGFDLPDLDGVQHSLSEYQGQVVVLEWINPNCPFSKRHADEQTMIDLAADDDIVFLGINSTNPKSGDYLEPMEHKAYNATEGITYPVLYDSSGTVGHAYGARTTPHMFVIDTDGTLVYNGAIDDDPSGHMQASQRANYVAAAVSALEAGSAVDPATTKPYGCSVKY